MSIKELQNLHHEQRGTKEPKHYWKIFEKLRQHFVFYHGWQYYDIP